jgi:hypothetical protein
MIFAANMKATSLNMTSGTHTITHIMILSLTHRQKAAVRPNRITSYGSHKRCSVPTLRQRSVALPWHMLQLNRNYWILHMAHGTEWQSKQTEQHKRHIIIIKSFNSLWSIGHPWRVSRHRSLQLSPWPCSMIFLCFLSSTGPSPCSLRPTSSPVSLRIPI